MVRWTQPALRESQRAINYRDRIDPALGMKLYQDFFNAVLFYEAQPNAGNLLENLDRDYRRGYTRDSEYKIYYRILAQNDIKILMVRSSRQKPPTTKQIRSRG